MARTSIALLIELKNATPNPKNVYKSEAFCFQIISKTLICLNAATKHLRWHIFILTVWLNQGTKMSCQLFWVSDCLVLTRSIPQHLFIFPSPFPTSLFPNHLLCFLSFLFFHDPSQLQELGWRLKDATQPCCSSEIEESRPFPPIELSLTSMQNHRSQWHCTKIIQKKLYPKPRMFALAKGKNEVLLIYQLSILPCPIYLQKGKFGDTSMIGHKLIR